MAFRIIVVVLAALAVAGIGWNGWEQHRQTDEMQRQSCIAEATAQNAVGQANLSLLFRNGIQNLPVSESAALRKGITHQADRIDAC